MYVLQQSFTSGSVNNCQTSKRPSPQTAILTPPCRSALPPATPGAAELPDGDPLRGGRGGPARHHRRPAGGHARRRPRPPAGRHHHPQRLLRPHPPGLQCPHAHPALGPHPPAQRRQPRGPAAELGHHQLHHQGASVLLNGTERHDACAYMPHKRASGHSHRSGSTTK